VTRFNDLIQALLAAPEERPFITYWSDEDEYETVTFGDFSRRSRAQAQMLRDHGLSAGDRVVIIMPQQIAAMTIFVGAMMLGAVPAFLAYPSFKMNPDKYRTGLAGVTANLGARIVVIDDHFPDEMHGYVSLNDGARLLRAGEATSTDREAACDLPEIRPDGLAFIQHSAGTTGLQKGVALTHRSVLTQLYHLASALKIDEATDVVYSWLPLYHDMGLIACFVLPMVFHLPIVMQSPLDWVIHPETMLQVVTKHKCTLAWLPNFAFQFVSRRATLGELPRLDLSSLRALINCSEPVRSSSMDEFCSAFTGVGFRRSALLSSYAMAENVFAVTQSGIAHPSGPARIWVDGARFRKEHLVIPVAETTEGALSFLSSGRVLPNTEVRIDSEGGGQPGETQVGEILIQSDSLFSGYFNRPDLTASAVVDGWYHTGDLGFLLHGELYVVGRRKDLLIVAGENLYPQDIEEIIATHAAVHDGRVVAVGVYNPNLGTEDVIAAAEVERTELLANCDQIEREIRSLVVQGMGVAVRTIFLKPPNWIVKSTAGKPARSATREKLLLEHPELAVTPSGE
jgi:acyl-CoA synthetase (AMP-forming)/AMP-acid ligase II